MRSTKVENAKPVVSEACSEAVMPSTFRWLGIDEVLLRYPFSRQGLVKMVKRGEFPKSYRLGDRRVAWRSDELDAWDAARRHSDVSAYVPSANSAENLAKRSKGRGRPRKISSVARASAMAA